MKIYNRFDTIAIFECKKKTMKETVEEAVAKKINLTYANLIDINLAHANLTKANLAHANLTYANLTDANLTGANLTGANLCDCKFEHTKITYRGETVEVNFTEIKR